jgi:hypothetical protein
MDIDAALIAEGTAQLNKEIKVLEAWLAELEGESARDSQTLAARKSYSDMLTSPPRDACITATTDAWCRISGEVFRVFVS